MMKIAVGILIYVQGDYFQCSSCLAEKGKRICDNEAYTPPKKVRHSHHSDTSTPSLNVIGFAKQNHLWTIVTTSPTLTHTHPVTGLSLWLALKVTINWLHESKRWQGWIRKKSWRTWKWKKKHIADEINWRYAQLLPWEKFLWLPKTGLEMMIWGFNGMQDK